MWLRGNRNVCDQARNVGAGACDQCLADFALAAADVRVLQLTRDSDAHLLKRCERLLRGARCFFSACRDLFGGALQFFSGRRCLVYAGSELSGRCGDALGSLLLLG
jgi:hypothetical protein